MDNEYRFEYRFEYKLQVMRTSGFWIVRVLPALGSAKILASATRPKLGEAMKACGLMLDAKGALAPVNPSLDRRPTGREWLYGISGRTTPKTTS